MARPATGQVVRNPTRGGFTFALRFRAYGSRQYVTLGGVEDGWTQEKADRELAAVMRDVDRGKWRPAQPDPAAPIAADPTFHEFASDWLDASKGQWRAATITDYKWRLEKHLLPFFKDHRLRQVTVAEVDRYRESKVSERVLSAESINKTLTLLGRVLDVADERELIDRNPLRVNPRNRRLRSQKPVRTYLDLTEHIAALIVAAGELDGAREHHGRSRRPLLGVLAFAGLRLGEALALRWRDVNLSAGRLRVAQSKTDAAVRYVDLLGVLRDLLVVHQEHAQDTSPNALIFPTAYARPDRPGATRRQSPSNVGKRVLGKTVARADGKLTGAQRTPLPEGLTAHSLRRTFASILVALGEDPGYVMDQMGHTGEAMTMSVYRQAMRRHAGERERLHVLVASAEWAVNGQWEAESFDPPPAVEPSIPPKTASEQRFPQSRRADSNR